MEYKLNVATMKLLPKNTMLLAGLGVGALITFGAIFSWIVSGDPFGTQKQLRFGMELLDTGRWDLAGRLVRDLEAGNEIVSEESSESQYILGVSKLLSVQEDLDQPKNRRVLLEAVDHLKKSEAMGFPIGYQGKGMFYLGYCEFNTYQWDRTLEKLKDVPFVYPEKRSESYEMMIEANLRKQPADIPKARELLKTWGTIPGLAEREAARVRLTAAHVAMLENRLDDCEAILGQIPPTLPEYSDALLWKGRWRTDAAQKLPVEDGKRAELLSEAQNIFRSVTLAAETPNELRRRSAFLTGKALRLQGELPLALGTLSGIRQRNPQSAEAIASGIEEAEILLEQNDLPEVVSTIQHILHGIEDLSLYNEYWLSASELRTRILELGRALRTRKEYDMAIEFARNVALAFPKSNSVQLEAETYLDWGDTIAQVTSGTSAKEIADHRKRVEAKYLMAAEKFTELAQLELRSADYPAIIWNGIQCYQKGNSIDRANELLKEYLQHEDRTRRPRGLLAYGQNYMRTGDWAKALEPLNRCLIEFPSNPVSYEARLLAAQVYSELNQPDQSIELLQANLTDYELHPRSEIWQKSLYELGTMIYRRGDMLLLEARLNPRAEATVNLSKLEQSQEDLVQAVHRLLETASREAENSTEARYLAARSLRMAAQTPEAILAVNPNIVETAKRQLMQKRRALLEESLEEFQSLRQAISIKSNMDTTDAEKAIVRNCYFGEANALYDLGRWEDAIQAYRSAASRFLNQPESLEALVQMARCYEKLGKKFEAQKTLGQAEQVLKRIPPEQDANFVKFTRSNRKQWEELIGWLRKWD